MTNADIKITDAGRGWVRVWVGSELIAACPSRGTAEDVVSAILARDSLAVAENKITLLESALESQLANRVFREGVRP